MLAVYQATGSRAILYTNPATIKHLSPIPADLLAHDLWLAHYLNPLSIAAGWQPTYKPWSRYTFWQYTDRESGARYGTTSKQVDGNFFNGDYDQLVAYSKSFTGGGQPQPDIISRVAALEAAARLHGWNV
jgi:GH25 family lysozyme M1 (1,4-beta-N-acetylmuramidase)